MTTEDPEHKLDLKLPYLEKTVIDHDLLLIPKYKPIQTNNQALIHQTLDESYDLINTPNLEDYYIDPRASSSHMLSHIRSLFPKNHPSFSSIRSTDAVTNRTATKTKRSDFFEQLIGDPLKTICATAPPAFETMMSQYLEKDVVITTKHQNYRGSLYLFDRDKNILLKSKNSLILISGSEFLSIKRVT